MNNEEGGVPGFVLAPVAYGRLAAITRLRQLVSKGHIAVDLVVSMCRGPTSRTVNRSPKEIFTFTTIRCMNHDDKGRLGSQRGEPIQVNLCVGHIITLRGHAGTDVTDSFVVLECTCMEASRRPVPLFSKISHVGRCSGMGLEGRDMGDGYLEIPLGIRACRRTYFCGGFAHEEGIESFFRVLKEVPASDAGFRLRLDETAHKDVPEPWNSLDQIDAGNDGGRPSASTVVATDKDKDGQLAVKRAVDRVLHGNYALILVHVEAKPNPETNSDAAREQAENEISQLFLPYRGLCGRKGVGNLSGADAEVVLEDNDISKATIDYIHGNYVHYIVVGASSRNALTKYLRFSEASAMHNLAIHGIIVVTKTKKSLLSFCRKCRNPDAKPEPLVHRDLKPANILLDRNHLRKISNIGPARLFLPSVANQVTRYLMTSTAGTKSDIYSFGILLLQIITAKLPMGLTHPVERAIERGTFTEMLDATVKDWPVEETLGFSKLRFEVRRTEEEGPAGSWDGGAAGVEPAVESWACL
ncbi:Universal stress protein family [Musa troglodytarum]|uniref:RING-type E3 ubiquitin transferase n=1 Tax=Musa troglodytarum TaxID=320322 RepID=A0A9E7EC93_9LILI|nr:Universal stress protein family [Musa troglodytarum]